MHDEVLRGRARCRNERILAWSAPAIVSLCRTLIDQEDTALDHNKDKLRVDMDVLRRSVIEHAAKKASRQIEYPRTPPGIDSEEYIGKLSANPYDPDSVSNPYGRYGSPYSPYGGGNPYRSDSPTNPYGSGWCIKGR